MVEMVEGMVKVVKAAYFPQALKDDLLQNWALNLLKGQEFWSAYRHAKRDTLAQYRGSPLLEYEGKEVPERGGEPEDEEALNAKAVVACVMRKLGMRERWEVERALGLIERGEGLDGAKLERLRRIFAKALASLMSE